MSIEIRLRRYVHYDIHWTDFNSTQSHKMTVCGHILYLIAFKSEETRNQDRQYTYNVTLRRVHETTVAVEKQ